MSKLQIISTETIKPSVPNPCNPGSYKINVIDRSMPPTYIPLISFYHKANSLGRTQQLKKSLSETLTRFFPLAGRMKEQNRSVECNDDGAQFVEARVEGQLSEFLQRPAVKVLTQMVPRGLYHGRSGSDVLLAVQLNHFDCGGLAIGVGMFHKLGDASSLAYFFYAWACTARNGSEETLLPDFTSSAVYPVDGLVPELPLPIESNIVTKRFVFDRSKIAALRSRSMGSNSDPKAERPTRYEAVSALIWNCLWKARGEGGFSISASRHMVNLRGRTRPPLPENSFGNFAAIGIAAGTREDSGVDVQSYLQRKVRGAVRKFDTDYTKQLQTAVGLLKHMQSVEAPKADGCDVFYCNFTSWCRFPFYEADFGWGKPIWVSTCAIPTANWTIFMDTRSGDGMEAWVSVEEEKMVKFEQDEELLSFVSYATGFD